MRHPQPPTPSFSALQRAENFSICDNLLRLGYRGAFQCSSASRKFLNLDDKPITSQHCAVSVLFSEPKISQSRWCAASADRDRVSVLFSEPKISQYVKMMMVAAASAPSFSALQRAENFSINVRVEKPQERLKFQCSSASRKFLNNAASSASTSKNAVSVLFSEPKISQSKIVDVEVWQNDLFQCSSASRKFLNR